MSPTSRLVLHSLACVAMAGCAPLKPAYLADLRKGEQIAGIDLRSDEMSRMDSRGAVLRRLENLGDSRKFGYHRTVDSLLLTGLEGDLEAILLFHQNIPGLVLAVPKRVGPVLNVEAEAARHGLELQGTFAVTARYGELVRTNDPKLLALLRNQEDGTRELWALLYVANPGVLTDSLWSSGSSLPPLLSFAALVRQYDASLASGDLVSGRSQLAVLRGLRSSKMAELNARYDAALPKVLGAARVDLTSRFKAASLPERLELLPVFVDLLRNDLDRADKLSVETGALVRSLAAELKSSLADETKTRAQLQPVLDVVTALAAAPDEQLLPTVLSGLPPLRSRLKAETELLRRWGGIEAAASGGVPGLLALYSTAQVISGGSPEDRDAATAYLARVATLLIAALEVEQAAASKRGHISAVAGLNLVIEAVQKRTGLDGAVAKGRLQQALIALATRSMPMLAQNSALPFLSVPAFGSLSRYGDLKASDLKPGAVAPIAAQLEDFSAEVEPTLSSRQVNGSYHRTIMVSNHDAVNAWFRKENEYFQTVNSINREIREARAAAQPTFRATSSYSRENVLNPQGSKYVYGSKSTYSSTTTTSGGDSDAAARADSLEKQAEAVTAAWHKVPRPPDMARSFESVPWTHTEELQTWTGTLKRKVTLRWGGQEKRFEQTYRYKATYARTQADKEHNVQAADTFTTKERALANMTAEANSALGAEFVGPAWRQFAEQKLETDLKALKGTAAEIDFETQWTRFFMGEEGAVRGLDFYLKAHHQPAGAAPAVEEVAAAPAEEQFQSASGLGARRIILARVKVDKDSVELPLGILDGVRLGDQLTSHINPNLSRRLTVVRIGAHASALAPELPDPGYADQEKAKREVTPIDGDPAELCGPKFEQDQTVELAHEFCVAFPRWQSKPCRPEDAAK